MPLGSIRGEIGTEKDTHHAPIAAERTASKIETVQEVRLFHSLNHFIDLVSNEANRSGKKDQTRVGSNKVVSNFLRLNLLSYLRQLQRYPDRCEKNREVLIQWWVTLLNFLNSDLIPDETGSDASSTHFLSFPDPLLSIETISVCLECVSRLISSLMILPMHHVEQTEIYSHHILLSIHYVTNRLILNAKHSRQSMNGPNNQALLHFLNSYSSLLRSFLGKLNAYAYFYLPDEFHYDTQVMLAITPDVTIQENECDMVFSWKRKLFIISKDSGSRLDPKDFDTGDTKFFKIVISYLKNDFVFMAFYWHYWYIVLRYSAKCERFKNADLDIHLLPGAFVLLEHVTASFLGADLSRFAKFVRSTNTNKTSNFSNAPDTMPESSAAVTEAFMTNEMLNEFVFTNFSILRLWECLRSLAGCFKDDSNLKSLLRLHDSSQLKHVAEVSAYDYGMANVIYNKILQFVIFQFDSFDTMDFLNWSDWCRGIVGMLHTLNSNCQVVALLWLFNNWTYIPVEDQYYVTSELLGSLWYSLTVDCDFQLSKVLFFKLLVFRVSLTSQRSSKELFKKRLQDMFDEMCFLDSQVEQFNSGHKQDTLLFYGNKKFFLLPNKYREECDLIFTAEREMRSKVKRNHQNFPTVVSSASVRPSMILRGGRYPYDVFDEMVVKAALLVAERRRKNSETPLPRIDNDSSGSLQDSTPTDTGKSKSSSSISSALGSWFSKLSTGTDSRGKKNGSPARKNLDISNQADKVDPTLASCRSTDMLSMHSTVSSLATGRTNPSEEHLEGANRSAQGQLSKPMNKEFLNSDKSDQFKRKKLLSPVELKYNAGVVDHTMINTLFKAMNVPCESIYSKVEKANANWSVSTARTYDKPLPKPADTAVETFIEGLRSNSLQSLEEVQVVPEQIQKQGHFSNESTLQSSFSDNTSLPRPDYSILAMGGENTSTSDSELLARMQKFALNPQLQEFLSKEETSGFSNAPGCDLVRDSKTLDRNKRMHLETRITKLSTLLKMFNQTVGEYYEHLNFINHDSIFLEFEIKTHSVS